MPANDSWIYQGRQHHMWFGHGTKPGSGPPDPSPPDALPSLAERIRSLGHTLVAGLPQSLRHHAVARLDADDRARLERVMTGVVAAAPMGVRVTAARVLDTEPDALGVPALVEAGLRLRNAQSYADLRDATDLVARSAREMGLDRFRPFLRRVDDHIDATGGISALV